MTQNDAKGCRKGYLERMEVHLICGETVYKRKYFCQDCKPVPEPHVNNLPKDLEERFDNAFGDYVTPLMRPKFLAFIASELSLPASQWPDDTLEALLKLIG
jgi:hypothetical protein